MKKLHVELGDRSYPIYIGPNLIGQPDLFRRHISSSQILVVTDETVGLLYLQHVVEQLAEYQVSTIVLPVGEVYKNLATVGQLFDQLIEARFSRNATIIALGGGVIGDTAGFAAACYQRGIAFLQVPTTLLSQVDSSVGGKTGVNHPQGKNMIGAFYQPRCVIADTSVLDTLADRELSAGLAEVIKYGLIRDADFFCWLEQNIQLLKGRDADALAYAIEISCLTKANIVSEDETEAGIRAILNLGHTFGHAIEAGMGYGSYLHGEAVAIGMCQAADLSRRLGFLSDGDVDRIISLLSSAGLPVAPPESLLASKFLELMAIDKKNIDGNIRFILLETIGQAKLPCSVDLNLLDETLNEYGRI